MIRKVLSKVNSIIGQKKKRVDNVIHKDYGYELHKYTKADGSFDYLKYKKIQIDGNKKKIDKIWVQEENIMFLSDYIQKNVSNLKFGLCHGTRRGREQEWFQKFLDIDVLGTEISDNALEFPNTIQWDFHEVKPEWIGKVDFIYSNSFDHSYDPKKCLDNWMSCISKGGVCIIEHTSLHEKATELDPFGASVWLMPYLILIWSEGRYCVNNILTAPKQNQTYVNYLIIKNV